jgi:hypothetical protein
MTLAIQVVWWIGLVGALAATLVILKEVALVLRALRGIHRLAVITRRAARGVAVNLECVPRLAPLPERARPLVAAHAAVRAAGASLERFRDEPRRSGG